jgi:two-component sensor histidine kinase
MFFDDKHENAVRALGIGMNVTERKATETRQRLILREMNHRVKNNLAIIQAIISQTLRTTPDTNTAFERIQSRLDSLARTHDFLNNDQWLGIRLGKLLRQALDPFLGDAPERLVIEGPSVALDSSATLALGLIFHELGANALKHGAWSVPKGRVMVNWSVTGDDTAHRHLFLNWLERDGPAPPPPSARRHGFGMRLIEVSARGSLDGDVRLDFTPEGLEVHLQLVLAEVEPVLQVLETDDGVIALPATRATG